MKTILETPSLHFELNLAGGSWSLESARRGDLRLQAARMRADYRGQAVRRQALKDWRTAQVSEAHRLDSPHGPLQAVQVDFPAAQDGLRWGITFALPEDGPFFLWRLSVENQGRQPALLGRLTLLDAHFDGLAAPAFFSNGWGSWDFTGVYGRGDCFWRTRLGPFTRPMRVNAGTPEPHTRGHFAADMFGVLGDRGSRRALLAGFLSQCQQFGSLDVHLSETGAALQMWANGDDTRLDPGARVETDWACLHFLDVDQPAPLDVYFQAAARQNGLDADGRRPASQAPRPLTGWCSWYHFFQQVTAQDVRRNLEILRSSQQRASIPVELVQIDDGFEACVGDWFDFAPSFPDGVTTLAQEIRSAGFVPGLWLAPFILLRRSRLYKEHPDWLLRGRFNRPVNAGFVWNGFNTALDLSHPGALDYVHRVIDTAVHDWGFPYLKLDFLYAGALAGRRRDQTLSRAQIFRRALEVVRQAAGEETFLLGCGCPLGPALGLVDAMRIGPDVDVRWPARFKGLGWLYDAEPGVPSARNSVHNTLTRAGMHNRWWLNDPDCLLLRPNSELTLAEVQTLAAAIAFSGGLALVSDDLSAVPPERLAIIQAMLPPIGQAPQVVDWFDSARPARLRLDLSGPAGDWHLLGLINWQDEAQAASLRLAEFGLPAGAYWASRFWDGGVVHFSGEALSLGELPPHGCAVLALRSVSPNAPQYLGSDLHISQGLEVDAWDWQAQEKRLAFSLARPGGVRGYVTLALPAAPATVQVDDLPAAWHAVEGNVYRLAVDAGERVEIVIRVRAGAQAPGH